MAPMNPIAGEEPVSKRRYDTSANNDQNESRPVHSIFLEIGSIVLLRTYIAEKKQKGQRHREGKHESAASGLCEPTASERSVWKAPATEERRLIDRALRTCYDTGAMKRTKNAGACSQGGPEGLPLRISANPICYNSSVHGVRHACDKDGE